MAKRKRSAPAIGVNVKEIKMADKDSEKIDVSIKMKARGDKGFSHDVELDYVLSREQLEKFQRTMMAAVTSLQRHAK